MQGDVEKKKNWRLKMINMKAEEFDKRFDNGEDINDLMVPDRILTVKKLKDEIDRAKKNSDEIKIEITLTKEIVEKLKKKASLVGLQFQDVVKAVIAKELGVL